MPVIIEFDSYERSIHKALDALDAVKQLTEQKAILIKPNLVNDSPPPITTPPEACEAIITYIRKHSSADIVIAEGCGSATLETDEIFKRLGYTDMAERLGIPLHDLNYGPARTLTKPGCPVFPEIHLPEIAFTHYIISVPMLKAHSLAKMTGTLKNMLGFAQPGFYSGTYGIWKKAFFHGRMQDSLIDLNRYLMPNLTVMDCSVGMVEHHLYGPHCDPPVNKILAGFDPWEVDREAAGLLGLNWKDIRHIAVGAK